MSSKLSSNSLRAGIIGSGFMGVTHSRAIRALGGTVVAAVGSSPERADNAAIATRAEFGLPSVEELLSRADIDVIHVCTPNVHHETLAALALQAGKAVVCEKPLAIDAASARKVVEAAELAGRLGTVPFVYRFHPMVRELRFRIANGELGSPSVIQGSYLQDWLASSSSTNWRVDPALGGSSRAFADIGSHWFDLLEFVSGSRVARVSAQSSTIFSERAAGNSVSTEDAVSVQFILASGAIGTMVVSQVAAGRKNRLQLEISGTDSSFSFDQEEPEKLWVGRKNGSAILSRDPLEQSADAARFSFLPAGHTQGYQDAFNEFMNASYSMFANTGDSESYSTIPSLRDGLRAAQICDAVIQSANDNSAWVSLADLPEP